MLSTKISTYIALGFPSLAHVAFHRMRMKLGLYAYKTHEPLQRTTTFFRRPQLRAVNAPCPQTWIHYGHLFDFITFPVGEQAPDWLRNPATGEEFPYSDFPWYKIPDFDENVGDIKYIWELSRFSWVLPMAQRARNGDNVSLARLNAWISDWNDKNPSYFGPNWKCAQEASIRLMNVAIASLILGQARNTEYALLKFVKIHLQRIVQTLPYARAQKNNHATSEAAALFIGGSWLEKNGHAKGSKYSKLGRRHLERLVATLVEPDGSFSQHSVNYHRVFLDTVSMVELWRRNLSLPAFSDRFMARSKAAAEWLRYFIFSSNGDTPNLGANDGARLLQLGETRYRDYRQSAQLGAALFESKRAFDDPECDNHLAWLGIERPREKVKRSCVKIFPKGSYVIANKNGISAMLRLPRRKFRPSHCDALHLDIWFDGQPRFVDGGSYSYNSGLEWHEYFTGVESHNTVQFDQEGQMPRLGRFLFGDWIECKIENTSGARENFIHIAAKYSTRNKRNHYRAFEISDNQLKVIDEISGFKNTACLRWRLSAGEWEIHDNVITGMGLKIRIESNSELQVILSEGFQSLHYTERTPIKVIEAKVFKKSRIITEISRQ